MVRYFYAWTPPVIVGTVVLLTLPWLGPIALLIFALVALGALAALSWAVIFVPYMLGRAVIHRWHSLSGSSRRPVAALSPANAGAGRIRSAPAGAVLLVGSPSERET